jgi:hypothetical protein
MRVLVLSARLSDNRAAAFRALTQSLGELRFIRPGEPLSDVSEHDAIVVDGPQPAQPLSTLAALRAAVERGASLVAIGGVPTERDGFWADLLGVIAGPEPPTGEYYARVTAAHSHISDRVTREFAVVDGFVPLIPLADGKVIVDVSVALRDLSGRPAWSSSSAARSAPICTAAGATSVSGSWATVPSGGWATTTAWA